MAVSKRTANGDIVVTIGRSGKIKKVVFGNVVVTKPLNLQTKPHPGSLANIAVFEILTFLDDRSKKFQRCIHMPGCWYFCV